MALVKKNVNRQTAVGALIQKFDYVTSDDTKAQVGAAGYFNGIREDLDVGSILTIKASNGVVVLEAVTVPSTGNITTNAISS